MSEAKSNNAGGNEMIAKVVDTVLAHKSATGWVVAVVCGLCSLLGVGWMIAHSSNGGNGSPAANAQQQQLPPQQMAQPQQAPPQLTYATLPITQPVVAQPAAYVAPPPTAIPVAQTAGHTETWSFVVQAVGQNKSGSMKYLNDGVYPNNTKTIVLTGTALGIDTNAYRGRLVSVTGPVTQYNNKPQIMVSDPGQIRMQ